MCVCAVLVLCVCVCVCVLCWCCVRVCVCVSIFQPLLVHPAGLPAGVCNIVYGTGPRAGEAIVKHPAISLISFTGSTAVGSRIQSVSAPYVKKLSLEVTYIH